MTPRRAAPAVLALAIACATAGTTATGKPVPGQPSFPDLGRNYRPPTPEDPLCLGTAMAEKLPPVPEGRVVLRFPVDPSGMVGDVTILADTAGVSHKVLVATEESIRVCKWLPAQDPQGRTVQVFVVLPVEFLEAPAPRR